MNRKNAMAHTVRQLRDSDSELDDGEVGDDGEVVEPKWNLQQGMYFEM